jgi:hypothetical protein
LIIEVAFGRLLADAVELGEQVVHLQPFEEDAEFHHDGTPRRRPAAAAYTHFVLGAVAVKFRSK